MNLTNLTCIVTIGGALMSGEPAAPYIAIVLITLMTIISYKRFRQKVEREKQLSEAREEAFLAIYAASQSAKAGTEKKRQPVTGAYVEASST
jgi:hypothetical protein